MLDLACHAAPPQAVPIAALLRGEGLAWPLAHLIEQAVLDRAASHAGSDPGLDAAVDGLLEPAKPVPCAPPAVIDDPCRIIAEAVAPSVLLGPLFGEAIAAVDPTALVRTLEIPPGPAPDVVAARREALAQLLGSLRLRQGEPLATRLLRLLEMAPGERGILAAALATMPGAELFVCHGLDLEHALGAPPRLSLMRSLARLRVLAASAAGRVVAFVPCDPARREVVAVVREALERGFAGVTLHAPAVAAIADEAGRPGRARLVEVLTQCASIGAPVVVHLGAGPVTGPLFGPVLGPVLEPGRRDAELVGVLAELLDHRRLHSLRVAVIPAGPGMTIDEGPHGPVIEVDDAMEAALALAASRPRTWCGVSPALAAVGPAAVAETPAEGRRLWREGIVGAVRRDRRLADRMCMAGSLPHGDHALLAAGLENMPALLRAARAPAGLAAAFTRESALDFLDLPRFAKRSAGVLSPEEIAGLARLATRAPSRPTRRRRSALSVSVADVAHDVDHLDCIVIGAGIAGIAAAASIAARRTWQGRPIRVAVVEGSQRIGGRLHTWRDGPWGPLELGAELIHRPPADQLLGNFSLWNDVRRLGLATRSVEKLSASHIFNRHWRTVGPPLRQGCAVCGDPGAAAALDVLSRAAGWTTTRNTPDVPAQELLRSVQSAGPLAVEPADLLLTGTVPGRLHELSVASLAADRVKDQEMSLEEYHVTAGFDALPEALARGIDVRLGFEVDRVTWSPASGVTVRARDGRSLGARCAVCTVSVGVLRAGRMAFDPPLPEFKRQAIGRLECGPISKAVLCFDRRFWPASMSILGNLDPQRRAGRSYFVPLFGAEPEAPVLTGLFNGDLARALDGAMAGRPEADSEDALPGPVRTAVGAMMERAAADLREMFQSPHAALLRWHVRSWANDPMVLGGTSFVRVAPGGSSRDAARVRWALREPTGPLFWAGEATAVHTNPWSVHGAHASGLAAAAMVGEFLRPTGE